MKVFNVYLPLTFFFILIYAICYNAKWVNGAISMIDFETSTVIVKNIALPHQLKDNDLIIIIKLTARS